MTTTITTTAEVKTRRIERQRVSESSPKPIDEGWYWSADWRGVFPEGEVLGDGPYETLADVAAVLGLDDYLREVGDAAFLREFDRGWMTIKRKPIVS